MKSEDRSMQPHYWKRQRIERYRYYNKECDITGHEALVYPGLPLHPACIFEDTLREIYAAWQGCPELRLNRYHVKMPYWGRKHSRLADDYHFVDAPENLTTTSISVIMVHNNSRRTPSLGFYFQGNHLPSFRERVAHEQRQSGQYQGIAGGARFAVAADHGHSERCARPEKRELHGPPDAALRPSGLKAAPPAWCWCCALCGRDTRPLPPPTPPVGRPLPRPRRSFRIRSATRSSPPRSPPAAR